MKLRVKTLPNAKNNKYLYRYMSVQSAINLLDKGIMSFSNPMSWPDPYEKVVLDASYKIGKKKYTHPLRNKVFIACFTEQYSCEAQWKMYKSPQQKLPYVEIQFNKQKLINMMNSYNVHYGKVVYVDTQNFRTAIVNYLKTPLGITAIQRNLISKKYLRPLLSPLLYKRIAFQYEQEWRFMVIDEPGQNAYVTLNKPWNECVEGVIIGPTKNNQEALNIKEQLSAYLPKEKIRCSQIYRDTRPRIIELS